MDETWLYHYDPEQKQQSVEWQHSSSTRPQIILSAKIHRKISRLDFVRSRWHPPHRSSSKGPNYQHGVFLISADAIEGHFEGNCCGKFIKVVLFLHDNVSAHRALATQKERAYLGFHCLDHPPYSPDQAPLDYHLFSGLKKN